MGRLTRILILFFMAGLTTTALWPQRLELAANLREDFRQGSSEVEQYHRVGNRVVFFQSLERLDGDERSTFLWAAGENSSSTRLLASFAGSPTVCPQLQGVRFFDVGADLWRTDGTSAGTGLFLANARCRNVRQLGDVWVIVARRGIWTTRSLATPPRRAREIPELVTAEEMPWRGHVVFQTEDRQIWATDGTPDGTFLVASDAFAPSVAGDRVLFQRSDFDSPNELWSSLGTPESEVLIRTTPQFFFGASASNGKYHYFIDAVSDTDRGEEVWRTDGTAEGTEQLTSLAPRFPFPQQTEANFFVHVGKLFFTANEVELQSAFFAVGDGPVERLFDLPRASDGSLFHRLDSRIVLALNALYWTTDGTAANTRSFAGPRNIEGSSAAGSEALFLTVDDGVSELWSFPESAAPRRLAVLPPGRGNRQFAAARAGSRIYLSWDFDERRMEPGILDLEDDPPRLSLLVDLVASEDGSFPSDLHAFDDSVLFRAYGPDSAFAWYHLTEGNPGAERLDLPGLSCGRLFSNSTTLFSVCTGLVHRYDADLRYLGASVVPGGTERWVVTTEAGLALVTDDLAFVDNDGAVIAPETPAGESRFNSVRAVDSDLFVTAWLGGQNRFYHWRPSSAEFTLITSFGAGSGIFQPFGMRRVGEAIWFGTDAALYRIDATTFETRRVDQEFPALRQLVLAAVLGDELVLWRANQNPALFLWDGSEQVPRLAVRMEGPLNQAYLEIGEDEAYLGVEEESGHTIWHLDSAARFERVEGIGPFASRFALPSATVVLGEERFLATKSSGTGRELWRLDGAQASLVRDLYPGAASSIVSPLVVTMNKIFFSGDDARFGTELWSFDPSGSPCEPEGFSICLTEDRFALELVFRTGDESWRPARALELTGETGSFWFFSPDNVEVLAKLVDGTAINERFWLFLGALTDLDYALDVVDLETGATRRIENVRGQSTSVGDVEAFPVNTTSPAQEPLVRTTRAQGDTSPCTAGDATFCLGPGDRFAASVNWLAFDGEGGTGRALDLSTHTTAVWFFDPEKLELVLKVVDGTTINGNWWFFSGSLSNVEYEITIRDTFTGRVNVYRNELGQFGSLADIEAFPQ